MKSLWIAAAFAVLAGACSKSESEAVAGAPNAPAAAQKTAAQRTSATSYPKIAIDTDAGLFWFEPRRCSVGPDADSGVLSFSMEGAGQSPDGQAVYVTLEDEDDNPEQGLEMRINVGTDQPFKTPEIVWIANDAVAHGLRIPAAKPVIEGQRITIDGLVFTRGGHERLTAKAAIQIDCSRRK
ncbi:hypothetical protein [Simplicispira suum]|uniref:hypothetical protein n=1 Tax=Simplicispira suum TaxID=2109915 RepID=UPI0011B255F0|nr:hypothetical protein [Simplicispira suum]